MENDIKTIVGIDPDVEASGYGLLQLRGAAVHGLNCGTMPLPELVTMLAGMNRIAPNLTVYVEAGWLNRGNWHLGPRDSARMAAAKGRQAGRNHQLGLDLCAWLDHYGIRHQEVAPLTKCWRGRDRKITHAELDMVIRNGGGAGMPRPRSNQEERDALLLAWAFGGMQIRIDNGKLRIENGKR